MLPLLTVSPCLQCACSVCVYMYVGFSIKINQLRKTLWLEEKKKGGRRGERDRMPEKQN